MNGRFVSPLSRTLSAVSWAADFGSKCRSAHLRKTGQVWPLVWPPQC